MKRVNANILTQYLRVAIASFLIFLFSGIPSIAADKVFFYHTDATGTPMAMTDSNGDVVWEGDYLPFGEEYEIAGEVKNQNRFIGKEKDEETDLYYFGARYLDARAGRFTATDPVGIGESDLYNPQRFNRYAYGLNNPYKYVDPDGNFPVLLLVVPVLYGILTSPTVGETPINSGDLHEDYSDVALIMNTAAATTVLVTATTEGLVAAGKEVVEEVTGVPASGFKGRKGFELKNAPYQKVRNTPATINHRSYSGHALDQMQNRGFTPSVVENTIQTGTKFKTKPGTTGYYDSVNNVRVITNSANGRVVTLIGGAP